MNRESRNHITLQIKKLFAGFPKVTASEETIAVWLDALIAYTPEQVKYAVDYWIDNEEHFPAPGSICKLAREKRRADAEWSNDEQTYKMLMDKEAPKFYKRDPDFDDREYRMRQLRKYVSLLKRYPDKENW